MQRDGIELFLRTVLDPGKLCRVLGIELEHSGGETCVKVRTQTRRKVLLYIRVMEYFLLRLAISR
jgi:hypothetical protein